MNYKIDYEKINRSNIIDSDMEINEEIREDRVNYIILENGFLREMIDKDKKVEDIVVLPKPLDVRLCDKVMVYRAFIHYYYYRNLKELDFRGIQNEENKEKIKKIEIILTDSISVCYLKNIPETVKYIILYNINNIEEAKNDLYYKFYGREQEDFDDRLNINLNYSLNKILNINYSTKIITFYDYKYKSSQELDDMFNNIMNNDNNIMNNNTDNTDTNNSDNSDNDDDNSEEEKEE